MSLDLRSLEVFYWVASLQGFGAAAKRLHTTQPAVSQRIATLEAELGGRLLERSGRTVRLTPRGRQLLHYAEQMLRLRQEMVTALGNPGLGGLVRLGVAETIVQTWLSTFIGAVSREHPGVIFDIEVDITPKLRAGLVRSELDLALMVSPIADPDFVDLDLCAYPIRLACSPAYGLPRHLVPAGTLLAHALITYPKTTLNYQNLEQAFRVATGRAPRMHVSSSLATITRMAVDGIGICAVPEAVIGPELSAGRLRLLETDLVLPPARFHATYRRGAASGLLPLLAEIACKVARDEATSDKAAL